MVSIGPGAYESKTYIGFEGRKNSLAPKLQETFTDNESRNHPGPCDYNTTTNFFKKRNPAFKFGKAQKPDLVSKEKASFPDPAQYEADDCVVKKDINGHVFSTSKRESDSKFMRQTTPGPGDYNMTMTSFNIPKFHMGIKLRKSENFRTPGPGQYDQPDIPKQKKAPAYS